MVLQCNNFEVIDLGVMVSRQDIIQAAKDNDVDLIGVSGLITPSLEEMRDLAEGMENAGLTMPLMVGGAATSEVHTSVKLAPSRGNGVVIHSTDASNAVYTSSMLINESKRDQFIKEKMEIQEKERENRQSINAGQKEKMVSFSEARSKRI